MQDVYLRLSKHLERLRKRRPGPTTNGEPSSRILCRFASTDQTRKGICFSNMLTKLLKKYEKNVIKLWNIFHNIVIKHTLPQRVSVLTH